MNEKGKISAVIITFNEEKNIARCIKSLVEIVDEIIVVDSFSEDNTIEIADKLGAKVFKQKFLGHIEQKNYAKNLASNNWIISLDADEEISKELKKSILSIKDNLDEFDGYKFNRLTNYCGKWIKHCGWYPDTKLRIFKKDIGAWGGKNPHDKFITPANSNIKHLTGDLLHYSFYTKQQHLEQIHKFSTIAAQSYFEKGKKSNLLKLIFSPLSKFVRNYIIKLGFLDGIFGFRICRLSAYATYLKYVKLKNIQKSKSV